MKRKPTATEFYKYKIREFKTRFTWVQCEKCGMEFKYEPMWAVDVPPWTVWDYAVCLNFSSHFFCKECFPYENDLIAHCDNKTEF